MIVVKQQPTFTQSAPVVPTQPIKIHHHKHHHQHHAAAAQTATSAVTVKRLQSTGNTVVGGSTNTSGGNATVSGSNANASGGNVNVGGGNTSAAAFVAPPQAAPMSAADIAARSSAGSLQLFDPQTGPVANDIQQGMNPDCGVMSALASMAANPEGQLNLENAMQPNADGSVTVTLMYQGQKETYTVTPQELANAGLSKTGTGSDGITNQWGRVMELAIGQYGQRHSDLGGSIQGGMRSSEVFDAVMGGHASQSQIGGMDAGTLWQTLSGSNGKSVITASTGGGGGGLVGNHGYSVLGTQGDGGDQQVILRNPWGNTVPGNAKDLGNGKFSMAFSDFRQSFSYMDVG